MFGTLFAKECKQMLHSLIYIIYLLIMVVFLVSQLGETQVIKEPLPNQDYYEFKVSTDETIIMGKTLANLVEEINYESFATYPTGFYKQVILSQTELEELKTIVEKCTGTSWNQTQEEKNEFFEQFGDSAEESYQASQAYILLPSEHLKYSDFKLEMQHVCNIIGRGSHYEESNYEKSAVEPMTYEDALKEYRDICETDGITGAYMRLFCDYAGILLAIMPIFLGVTRCVRDRRANVDGVIFSKKASSCVIVLSRYFANVVMMFLPILIIALIMQGPYHYQAITLGVTPHCFAFLSYSVMWLLPEIMFVTALAFLLSELVHWIAAVVVQTFYGVASLLASGGLEDITGFNLVPRWNTIGKTEAFFADVNQLYVNRLLYALLAMGAIVITIIWYGHKRRGGGMHGKKH